MELSIIFFFAQIQKLGDDSAGAVLPFHFFSHTKYSCSFFEFEYFNKFFIFLSLAQHLSAPIFHVLRVQCTLLHLYAFFFSVASFVDFIDYIFAWWWLAHHQMIAAQQTEMKNLIWKSNSFNFQTDKKKTFIFLSFTILNVLIKWKHFHFDAF